MNPKIAATVVGWRSIATNSTDSVGFCDKRDGERATDDSISTLSASSVRDLAPRPPLVLSPPAGHGGGGGGGGLEPTRSVLGPGRSLLKQLESFSEVVSIVGLRHAFVPSSSKAKKLLWLTLVVFGAAFMIFQIDDRVRYYFSWPTKVDLRIRYNSTLRFPTVTVCNENRMQKDAAKKLGIVDFLEGILPPFPNADGFRPNYSATSREKVNNDDWYSTYRSLRQPISQSVVKCVYEMNYCNMSEAFEETTTNMGFCFSFNPRRINYVTSRPGATNGLYLVLNTEQNDYLISNSPSAGFRVLLHEPQEVPLMKQSGFKVSPGYNTMVAVTLFNLKMLPHPYGVCSEDKGYTYCECMSTCESQYVMVTCGCREAEHPGSARVCSPEEVDLCVNNATDAFVLDGAADKCNCPRQCHQRSYQYSISQGEFSEYFTEFVRKYIFNGTLATAEFVRQNVAIVEIFFTDLTYEDIQTLASYDVLSLLCDIGGALGLILGSTVLTLFEIVDFVVSVATEELVHRRKKNTNADTCQQCN